MQVLLATVSRKVLDQSCYSVVLPTVTGQIEVLAHHAPLLTQLAKGVMRVKQSENEAGEAIKIAGGFAQVGGDQVRILTESAEK